MHQYLRSRFQVSPLHQWEQQWQALECGLFAQQDTHYTDA
jgi:hypothetical protein